MMEEIREYVLSVVCAAIVCSIVSVLAGQKGTAAPMRKLLYGLFLCLTVIRPVAKLRMEDFTLYTEDLNRDALAAAAMGTGIYEESLAEIISEQTEAYILDKAQSLDLNLTVTVQTDRSGIPNRVTLRGNAGGDAQQRLSEMLEEDLGIPKERQLWIE